MKKSVFFTAVLSAIFFMLAAMITTVSAEEYKSKEWPSDPRTIPTKKWEVTFNEAVDPAFINSTYFNVTDQTGGANRFPGITVESADGGETIVIHPPAEGYTKGATYSLHVSDRIQSVSGKKLSVDNYKQFTIQSPDTGDQQVTEFIYAESFKVTNHGQQLEHVKLPQSAAYAHYTKDGDLLNFGLAGNGVALNSGDYAILSFEQKVQNEMTLPANVTYEISKTPAILNVTHDKSVTTVWNYKGAQDHAELKFTGKHLSYYTLDTDNEVASLQYISEENPINTIRVEKQGVVSAEGDSVLQIYAPFNEFTYTTRTDPAIEKLVLADGNSAILSNTGVGYSHYSVFNTKDFMSEVDEVFYEDLIGKEVSWIEEKARHSNELGYLRSVARGNQVHLTNRSGSDVIIYAPHKDFIFETASVPALQSKVVQKGETAFVENHFSQWQKVQVEGEGLHDYVHYNNYEQRNASEILIDRRKDLYSLTGLSTIAITAKTDEPITVIAPFTNTTVTVTGEKRAVEYYTAVKGESILIENNQEFQQPMIFANADRVDSIIYSKDGTPFFESNQKIESWSRNYVLAGGGKRQLTNISTEPLVIAVPEGTFRVSGSVDSGIEKTEIGSMETVIFTNTSNAKQKIVIKDARKFDFVHYINRAEKKVRDLGFDIEEEFNEQVFTLSPQETLVFTNKKSDTLAVSILADKFSIQKGAASHTSTITVPIGSAYTVINKTENVQSIDIRGTGSYKVDNFKFGIEQPFISQHAQLAGKQRITFAPGEKQVFLNKDIFEMKISFLKDGFSNQ